MFEARVTISLGLLEKLDAITQPKQGDAIMRAVASTLLAVVHDRIHEKGLNASGQPIGTYSPGYMKVRTGNFGNSGRVVKGKNKGEQKNAGVFTKGRNKGERRPNYDRTNDTKVVISLTRQMENDFKVIATDHGYGLGYSNPTNFEKASWVEATYRQSIFALTDEERNQAAEIAKQEILNIFNG